MAFGLFFIFYLGRISFYLFFHHFDHSHCNAVTYLQGEPCNKYLLGEGRHSRGVEKIRACQPATRSAIRCPNANHSDFRARQGEARGDFNPVGD